MPYINLEKTTLSQSTSLKKTILNFVGIIFMIIILLGFYRFIYTKVVHQITQKSTQHLINNLFDYMTTQDLRFINTSKNSAQFSNDEKGHIVKITLTKFFPAELVEINQTAISPHQNIFKIKAVFNAPEDCQFFYTQLLRNNYESIDGVTGYKVFSCQNTKNQSSINFYVSWFFQ